MKHSLTGGSNAHLWWNCPGSVYLNKVVPNPESKAMADGTKMHEAAFFKLSKDDSYYRKLTKLQQKIVEQYIAMIPKDLYGKEVLVMSDIYDKSFGTIDCVWHKDGVNHICDFKTGKTPVSPIHNAQLLTYALWYDDVTPFVLHIAQPQVSDVLISWEPSADERREALHKLNDALDHVYHDPILQTGSHCEHCRACSFCPKKKEEAQAIKDAW
jgi:CRISPR/Cas system-associated exonuclease Cas4 (RecB family)